jgi:peroxiredoxin
MIRSATSIALPAVLVFALAAGGQTPVPAAPAPAPAVAPVVDAKAKGLLQESAIAITNIKFLTFRSKRTLEGAQLSLGAEADVTYSRNMSVPSASLFAAKGHSIRPISEEKVPLEVAFDGQVCVWVDEAAKKVEERRSAAADNKDARPVKLAKDQLTPLGFFEAVPFEKELRADVVELLPAEEIGGVKCQVVRTAFPSQMRETLIFIAESDKLPRRVDQISAMKTGKAVYSVTMTSVKAPDSLPPTAFKIADRPGFTRSTGPAPAVPQPILGPDALSDRAPDKTQPAKQTTPPNPIVTPAGDPPGGLAVGSAAPAFELPSAAGGTTKLESLRDNVVVLGFFSSRIAASKGAIGAVAEAAQGLDGKGVKFFAVASRENAADAGTKFLAEHKVQLPLLLNGESVATQFKLRGYPSITVIGKDGKIAAHLEGTSDAAEVKAAVEAALNK